MKKTNKQCRDYDDVVIEVLKTSEKECDLFLKMALEEYEQDGDEAVLLTALRQVAKAKGGFTELASKTGLTRASLYKTLSSKGNPGLKTIRLILEALGYGFKFKHI